MIKIKFSNKSETIKKLVKIENELKIIYSSMIRLNW